MHKLKLRRLRREITQYDLSRLTGIAQSKISLFENGLIKLRAAELERMNTALGRPDRQGRNRSNRSIAKKLGEDRNDTK